MRRSFSCAANEGSSSSPLLGSRTFPHPDSLYRSDLADVKNHSISGIKDKRINKILTAYDREFDHENGRASQRARRHRVGPRPRAILEGRQVSVPNRVYSISSAIRRAICQPDQRALQTCTGSGGSIRKENAVTEAEAIPSISYRWYHSKYAIGKSMPNVQAAAHRAPPKSVTSYFDSALPPDYPDAARITVVVFVITHFVPGGPVERRESCASNRRFSEEATAAGYAGRAAGARRSTIRRSVAGSTGPSRPYGLRCGTHAPRSGELLHYQIRSGTSSDPVFLFPSPLD